MLRLAPLLVVLAAACGHRRVLADLEPSLSIPAADRPDGEALSLALRAIVAEQDGQADLAEKAWKWLLRLRPDDAAAWAGYGGFLERQGRGDDALDAYGRAVGLDPGAAGAHLGAARVLLGRGADADAARHLEVAVRAGDPDAMHLLGRLRLRARDGRGAWEVYEAWSERSPTRSGECLDRGRLALALDREADAVDDLRCALEDEGAGPDVGEAFVKAARVSCRVGTAWRWALEHRVADREAPEWRAVAAAVGRAAGDADLMAAALGPGEGLQSGFVEDRVEILVRAGRADEAIDVLDAAIARSGDASLVLRRAEALGGAGRWDEALGTLDGFDPDDRWFPAAQRLRGEILAASGRPEEAVAVLGGLPEPPWPTLVVFARALALAGRVDDAEAALAGAERATEAERWRQIGLLRAGLGDWTGALEAFDEAGADPRALLDRAGLLERDGAPGEAAAAWQAAAEADPKNAEAWLGVARTATDPHPALIEATKVDPCHPVAWRLLAEEAEPCDAVALLERAWDAAPRDAQVLAALGAAYPACAEARRAVGEPVEGLHEGLGRVEWTWRVLGRTDEARQVADALRALEGG